MFANERKFNMLIQLPKILVEMNFHLCGEQCYVTINIGRTPDG